MENIIVSRDTTKDRTLKDEDIATISRHDSVGKDYELYQYMARRAFNNFKAARNIVGWSDLLGLTV